MPCVNRPAKGSSTPAQPVWRMVVHETYRDEAGAWVQPVDVRIVSEDGARKAFHSSTPAQPVWRIARMKKRE
jgi:hypothetical protein